MTSEDSPFSVQDVPGKGKGIIATRDIESGELVLLESPLFIQDRRRSNATILAAISSLTKEQQQDYFSLTNCHRARLPPLLGIFETNALPCGPNSADMGHVAQCAAIFLIGSRFNSSCLPNINNYWDSQVDKISFRTVAHVRSGEELCISYGSILRPQEDRKSDLKKRFGFDCDCVACSLSGEDSKASDERRSQISRLYDEIGCCSNNPSLGIKKVKTALQLLHEEGFADYLTNTYLYDAFQFCAAASDISNAKAWADKAWQAECKLKGPTSTDAQKMKNYTQNPRQHPAFGMSPKQSLTGPDTYVGKKVRP